MKIDYITDDPDFSRFERYITSQNSKDFPVELTFAKAKQKVKGGIFDDIYGIQLKVKGKVVFFAEKLLADNTYEMVKDDLLKKLCLGLPFLYYQNHIESHKKRQEKLMSEPKMKGKKKVRVTISHLDCVHMVLGVAPGEELFEEFEKKSLGSFSDNKVWAWNKDELVNKTIPELMGIYDKVKLSHKEVKRKKSKESNLSILE